MNLPVSTMIIAIAAIAAVVALIALFSSAGGGSAVRAQLENDFRQQCLLICASPNRATANLAALYPDWQNKCETLYGVERGAYSACLDRCGTGCLTAQDPCDYLRFFRDVVDNWVKFCSDVKTNPNTAPIYGSCGC